MKTRRYRRSTEPLEDLVPTAADQSSDLDHVSTLRSVWKSGDDLMELVLLQLDHASFLYTNRMCLMLASRRMNRLAWLTATTLRRKWTHPALLMIQGQGLLGGDQQEGQEAELPHTLLDRCPRLETLSLNQTRISSLLGLPHLIRNLLLKDCIELSDLSPLRVLSALKVLCLGGCAKIGDAQLSSIFSPSFQGVPSLPSQSIEHLELQHTLVTDLSPMSACVRLEKLIIESCPIASLESLRQCHALTTLEAASTLIDDLEPLSTLGRLATLGAAASRLNNVACMSEFSSKGTLETLCLSCNGIRDIQALHGFDRLTRLFLGGTLISDISHLGCPNLAHLDLHGTKVRNLQVDLKPLSMMTRLKRLNYSDDTQGKLQPHRNLPFLFPDLRVTDLSPNDFYIESVSGRRMDQLVLQVHIPLVLQQLFIPLNALMMQVGQNQEIGVEPEA